MKKKVILLALSAYVLFYAITVAWQNSGEVSGRTRSEPWVGLNDYRGLLHVHTELSLDSKGNFQQIQKAVKDHGVDFIVTADHWRTDSYQNARRDLDDSTLFIPGTELRKSDGVTILAAPLPECFIPSGDWRKDVDALHSQGALAIAAHTEFSRKEQLVALDGAEIWNIHAETSGRGVPRMIFAYSHLLLPWHLDLGFLVDRVDGAKRAHDAEAVSRAVVPVIAGDDNHNNYPGAGYARTFLLSSTHVWAKELSEEAILDALKNGRTYVAFEVFGCTDGFKAYVQSCGETFLPGAVLSFHEGQELVVELPSEGDSVIRVLKDGISHWRRSKSVMRMPICLPGIYSVEVSKDGHPWIFTSSFVIR